MTTAQETTTMDLATATPVEIDTAIAALWQERYRQQALRDQAWQTVQFHVSQVLIHQGSLKRFAKASVTHVRDFLREHSEISENEEMQAEAYEKPWIATEARKAWDAYGKYLDHDAEADEVLMSMEPLDEEYVRRGRWNRAFLVSNANGHVHRSMNCSTCYPTTQYHWLTDYSDKTEEEIVEAAGERACTVCYPSAPVEVLSRPTQMFTPDEREKQKARDEREAKAAERKAAEITVANYYEYGSQPRTKVFKTQRAVTNAVASALSDLCWYGTEHPSAATWSSNITNLLFALRQAGVEYDYDKALANARKKVTREGGEVKF